jgi:hypothetical protein
MRQSSHDGLSTGDYGINSGGVIALFQLSTLTDIYCLGLLSISLWQDSQKSGKIATKTGKPYLVQWVCKSSDNFLSFI